MMPRDVHWTDATIRCWQAMLAGHEIWFDETGIAYANGIIVGNQIAAQRLWLAGLAEWVPNREWRMRRRKGVHNPLSLKQQANDG